MFLGNSAHDDVLVYFQAVLVRGEGGVCRHGKHIADQAVVLASELPINPTCVLIQHIPSIYNYWVSQ